MHDPRVGLITFGDEREHEWNAVFRSMTEPRHTEARSRLAELPIALEAAETVARTRQEIGDQVADLRRADVEALVAHVPCWTAPNLVVDAVQRLGAPTALLSNRSPATHGTVALLGVGGALDQIGVAHLRVREDFDSGALATALLPFFRASAAVARLRGEVFGLFGGRSLGIDTGTFDPMQWRELFGVDVEHIDQLEIIRRAEAMSESDAEQPTSWLTDNVGRVDYGPTLTRTKLSFQVRCYLATKEIIAEKGLDFVAVKCMPDLATHFVPQCITAALLPSPYDEDGRRDPIVMACEADGDGALTGELLKHLSGGLPPLFADISYFDDQTETLYLPNCGALCSWYAARSDDPHDNLKQIELRPAIRPGGGAITQFHAAPGPVTLARLFRRRGRYHMAIVPASLITPRADEIDAFVAARGAHQLPTAFAKIRVGFDRLVAKLGSNHISGVAGDYVRELEHVCRLLDIVPILLDDTKAVSA
jgi:L-fucose/D-arabinose isomerase